MWIFVILESTVGPCSLHAWRNADAFKRCDSRSIADCSITRSLALPLFVSTCTLLMFILHRNGLNLRRVQHVYILSRLVTFRMTATKPSCRCRLMHADQPVCRSNALTRRASNPFQKVVQQLLNNPAKFPQVWICFLLSHSIFRIQLSPLLSCEHLS